VGAFEVRAVAGVAGGFGFVFKAKDEFAGEGFDAWID
jgi:hypothetical protein